MIASQRICWRGQKFSPFRPQLTHFESSQSSCVSHVGLHQEAGGGDQEKESFRSYINVAKGENHRWGDFADRFGSKFSSSYLKVWKELTASFTQFVGLLPWCLHVIAGCCTGTVGSHAGSHSRFWHLDRQLGKAWLFGLSVLHLGLVLVGNVCLLIIIIADYGDWLCTFRWGWDQGGDS